MLQREGRLQVSLRLDPGPDSDAREVDLLTQRLRQQLLLLDVESVEPVQASPPPPGARAVDAVALGAMVATLTRSPAVLKALVGTVQAWLGGSAHVRSIELQVGGDTLKVTGASSEDQRQLIQMFIQRHAQ